MVLKLIIKYKTIVFFGWLLATGSLFYACRENEHSESTAEKVPVKIIKANKLKKAFPIRTSGIMSSKSEMKLSFKTGGIIDEIFVDEGQTVKQGQLLAKLNLSEIEARVNQAKLGAEKAERDLQRATNLYNDSVATLEELQNARTAFDVAASDLRIAEFNKKYSMITAPSDGKILKKLAEKNEIIAAGHPLFLFGSREGNWVLRVALSDVNMVKISHKDSAIITFDAFPGVRFKGVVSEIAKASDPYTGTYEVELRLIDRHSGFVSGLIGKAEITPFVKNEYVVLPVEIIHETDDMTGYIYLIKRGGYEKRKIQIRHISDSMIYIGEGLNLNDSIISDGADFLEPGTEIEIID